EDKNEIFRAAHDASVATDYVLSLDREISRAEALESGGPAEQDLEDPQRANAREETLREEIATLEADREQRPDGVHPEGQTPRENTEVVARFEAGSGTVAVHAKQTATDHHMAVDAHGTAPELGASKSRNELSASFSAAKDLTGQALGQGARTFIAETE